MVALRDIDSDFFEFDQEHYRIVGRSSRKSYTLGDAVKIKVKKANVEQKLLDYELVDVSGNEVTRRRGDKGAQGQRAGKTGDKGRKAGAQKSRIGSTAKKRK